MNFTRSSLLTFVLLPLCIILPGVLQLFENQGEKIKIGLLVSDSRSVAAVHGAELAILEANREGGLNGVPFELQTRVMEGPWGTGSKEAVSLIFDEKVWAILGSHDGRNAHIVEQAATKANVVFVSAWAADPTLSQAFVPWFFNCIPTDRQQAQSIFDDIFIHKKYEKVAVIYDESYDSDMALKNLTDIIKASGEKDLSRFLIDQHNDPSLLIRDISRSDAECIVIFCKPSAAVELIRSFRQKKMELPVYGSLALLNENELTDQELSEYDNIVSVPSCIFSITYLDNFRREYQKAFNRTPGLVASFAFDGMKALTEAIKTAGSPDREKIQRSLQNMHLEGITGIISFDDKGNRKGPFKMAPVKNRIPSIF